MDYRTLHAKTVVELRSIARMEKVKLPAGSSKAQIIERILASYAAKADGQASLPTEGEKAEQVDSTSTQAAVAAPSPAPAPKKRGRKPKTPVLTPPSQAEAPAAKDNIEPEAALIEEAKEASPELAPQQPFLRPMRSYTQGSRSPQGDSRDQRTSDDVPPYQQGVRKTYAQWHAVQSSQNARRSFYQKPGSDGYSRNEQGGSYSMTPRQGEGYRGFDETRREGSYRSGYDQNTAYYEQNRSGYVPRAGQESYRSSRYMRREFVPQGVEDASPSLSTLLATGECIQGAGVLEIMPDGYGFLRAQNCQNSPKDVYVSNTQIRRFNLRMGDYVVGETRAQKEGGRLTGLLRINSINGDAPEKAVGRPRFEDLTPVHPNHRIRLEGSDDKSDKALRMIDILSPIGRGQRTLIVSPPKAGKTMLLKKIANAITKNDPQCTLFVLLIDERPEEVTDMQRSVDGEVVYSTFDAPPDSHVKAAELVCERAQRLVEQGKHVVILLDSITRLARAYNNLVPPSGRTLSGGLDPTALYKPKRFFGAARNIENGGSLTMIATALIETGSRMDDVIYEEFKGTGNSEICLDRSLSERRIFPAIDMNRSGTRRDDLLLDDSEMEGALSVRRMLQGGSNMDTVEQLLSLLEKTQTNEEFFQKLKGWYASMEKGGFTKGK